MKDKPEFSSLKAIEPYFSDLDDVEQEEPKIQFWRQITYEYCFAVTKSFEISTAKMQKDFQMFDRRPGCLPDILQELHRRKVLATREELLSGRFYQPEPSQSYINWFASSLYSNTVGRFYSAEPETAPTSFVSLEYLDR